MVRKMLGPVLAGSLVVAVSAAPQQGAPAPPQTVTVWAPHTVPAEKIDEEMIAKIRTEGMEHSKIMWIEHYLTDVYGPRPIGSPNHDAAAELGGEDDDELGHDERAPRAVHVARRRLAAGRASGFITSPVQGESEVRSDAVVAVDQRHGRAARSSASSRRRIRPKRNLTAFLAALAPKVKGGIVMVGAAAERAGQLQRGAEAHAG